MNVYVTQLNAEPGVDVFWSKFLVLKTKDGYSQADVLAMFSLESYMKHIDGHPERERAWIDRLKQQPGVVEAEFAQFIHTG